MNTDNKDKSKIDKPLTASLSTTKPPDKKPGTDLPNRVCPSCLSTEVTSKGRQPKTLEMRSECKTCHKQFATLHSENIAKVINENTKLKEGTSSGDVNIVKDVTIPPFEHGMAKEVKTPESLEEILRGGNTNSKRLTILYFTNVKCNKVGKIRDAIVNNTGLKSSQIVNIDFAEEDALEMFCYENDKVIIECELARLKITRRMYKPYENEGLLTRFTKRMVTITQRRSNTRVILKRFALRLSRLNMGELKAEMAKLKCNEINAAISDVSSEEMIASNDEC